MELGEGLEEERELQYTDAFREGDLMWKGAVKDYDLNLVC
jgi:hypothetical protein